MRKMLPVVLSALAIVVGSMTVAVLPGQALSPIPLNLYGSATQGWGLNQAAITSPGPSLAYDVSTTLQVIVHSVDSPTVHTLFIDYNNDGAPSAGEPNTGDFTSAAGTSFTFNLMQAGSSNYRCIYHPNMVGTITISGGGGGLNLTLIIAIVVTIIVVAAVVGIVLMRRRSKTPPQPAHPSPFERSPDGVAASLSALTHAINEMPHPLRRAGGGRPRGTRTTPWRRARSTHRGY